MPHIEKIPSKIKQEWIKSTCPYCGVGCGIEARVLSSGKLDVRGDKDHPANFGRLCSKGLALGDTVTKSAQGSGGRLLSPSINDNDCSWEQALQHVATSFTDIIKEHGPDAVAFYVSGQLLTEDYYVVNKLMKGFIGSANIDTNSRLCMASSVAGHKRAFGEDCVPGNYEDLELADLVVLVGSNLAWCHPVLYQRLKAAKATRGTKVVVIDPRQTSTCDIADLHLPLLPGSDIALFNGLLAFVFEQNALDTAFIHAHTSGFEEALTRAQKFSVLAHVAATTGLPVCDIKTFYQWFCDHQKTVTLFSQGVNQSVCGTDKVNAILNCHLATGRIGRPGSAPFSITGQPNAMGGREVGGLSNTLAAHLEFGNKLHANLLSNFWTNDLGCDHIQTPLPTTPGLKAIELFDAIEKGKIKAIWIMATNPAVSLPDSERVNALLAQCPLVIVSDCVDSNDTLSHAHVRLPAQGWGEKSGTVTNSERTVSRQRRLLPTPGEGKPDWWIVCEVAKKMGFKDAFTYKSEADIFKEHAKLTALGNEKGGVAQRKLNLKNLEGITTQEYHALAPQQWPMLSPLTGIKSPHKSASKRLFEDGHFSTPDKKARFIAVDNQRTAQTATPKFPLLLNTGRNRDQWHTMTRTGRSALLFAHASEPFVDIHPYDAKKMAIENEQLVLLKSKIGEQIFKAKISTHTAQGHCFAPIHWSKTHSSSAKVGTLISSNSDPLSGQPEYKATPVSLSPLFFSSCASFVCILALETTVIDALDPTYWVKQTIKGGYLYHFYFQRTLEDAYSHMMFKLNDPLTSYMHGRSAFKHHVLMYKKNALFFAFTLFSTLPENKNRKKGAPDMAALLFPDIEQEDIHAFLSGALRAKSPIICACKQVRLNTLEAAIAKGKATNLERLKETTCAGTGCGSCEGELNDILCQMLTRKKSKRA